MLENLKINAARQRKLKDPFDGFFKNNLFNSRENGLLNFNKANRWLKNIDWHSKNDCYIFQQAIESKSKPVVQFNGENYFMLSSYDYLGLIGHPKIEAAAKAAIDRFGTGSGGVRLLTGTTELHLQFEKQLANFKGTEAALTFSSGYMANIAAISGLMDESGLVLLDQKCHRSIIDACYLAKVPFRFYDHNDALHLETILKSLPSDKRKLIISEGIFSMDGDFGCLPDLVFLKTKYNAFLMLDEAHSFGCTGKNGRGLDEHFGLKPSDVDLWSGSLSKTIPSNGGFLAGSKELIYYLQHGAAPFFFSAALCPSTIAASSESLNIIESEPERLFQLKQNSNFLRKKLRDLGCDTGQSESAIIPIILKSDKRTISFAQELFNRGVLTSPVVFPAVPKGEARLRLCATALQSSEMLNSVIEIFSEIFNDDFDKA